MVWREQDISVQYEQAVFFKSLRMQEKEENLEISSSIYSSSKMGEKWRKGKGLTQAHTAREVSRTSFLAGMSEYTYSILLL